MATTVVAGEILPKGFVTNPWFDWSPALGIPIWFIILVVLILVFIIINLSWVFKVRRLASVRGFVDALKSSSQLDVMCWIISTTRNLTIEMLRKRDAAISFYDDTKTKTSWWIHNSPISVIHIGGKGGIILSEEYYRSRDMVSEMALVYNCDILNNNLEEYGRRLQKPIKPIKDYEDYTTFGRVILGMLFPDGIEMPPYKIFNPEAFRKYFPKGMTAMANGALLIREARKLKVTMRPKTFWEKYLPLGMFVAIGLISIIAAWMVPLGK